MSKQNYKTLVDRPFSVGHIKNFDRMVTELSPYMTEHEIDQCISFMYTLEHTKHDINPSVEDCKTQLIIMLGNDRFQEICKQWNVKNQKFLTVFGIKKYRHKTDKTLFDGLDSTDNPDDYETVYI